MGDYNADKKPALNKIRTVAFNYNFAAKSNLKVDQFSTTTSNKVYHLVKKIGSTNLSVLVNPDQVPG
jgi:hypothetical protein